MDIRKRNHSYFNVDTIALRWSCYDESQNRLRANAILNSINELNNGKRTHISPGNRRSVNKTSGKSKQINIVNRSRFE